jgi:hypothetical protein
MRVQTGLKVVGEAISRCIEMKDIFDRDVMTASLNQLVRRNPLPRLVMRTMIHTYTEHAESRRSALPPAASCICSCQLH